MAVRTKSLASGRVSVAGQTLIYTVPAGETTIIKSFNLVNLNSSTANVVTVLMDAGAFDRTTFERISLPASQSAYRDLWVVLHPGMEIALNLQEALGVNFWFSGTELEGVAD